MAIGGLQFLTPQEIIDLSGVVEGSVVGHLGAGAGGYFTIPLAHKVGITGKVYAVDIFDHVLQSIEIRAKSENILNIELVKSNLEVVGATSIKAHSLDMAFLINVLFQNTDKKAIMQEASRLLKTDGVLVIVDWSKGDTGFGPIASNLVSQTDILAFANEQGFRVAVNTPVGPYHFCVVLTR
ncbi:methyltransferase domain-containing protein [Candidatus Falkowbacteria bacterium]|nr:methyltransferase domain-containing protein [Candidatus Falkowbacteria bacterium]